MAGPTREPPKRSAQSYALWLLGRREYSAKELAGKLTQRGYPGDEAQAAVAWAQSHGFQSDARFAESRARSQSRRLGDRRLVAQLQEKGIDREAATQHVQEQAPETARAVALAGKFEGKPLDEALRAKVWRFLAYRGFSSAAIKAAVQHLKELERADQDQPA